MGCDHQTEQGGTHREVGVQATAVYVVGHASCLGKLGAHGMLKLDTILLLRKELLGSAAGWPGHAAQIV